MPGRGGGRSEWRNHSNLLLDLIYFIVSRMIVLLSDSGRFSCPYKYNFTSFWRKAILCCESKGTTFSARITLLYVWNGHLKRKCSVVSLSVLHRQISLGVSKKLCLSLWNRSGLRPSLS